jgi:peptidoglycan/LPS O-acetylase OafA/YrhL
VNRNPFLDVLRAALAWAVVGVHCAWFSGNAGPIQHQVGVWSVIGFVTISGYVITLSLVRRQEPYIDFVLRRLARLMPAFLACLALALVLRPLTIGSASTEAMREASENQFYPWHVLAHLSLLFGMIPERILPSGAMALLPPAWSISLEFQLYLAAPVLLYFLRKGKRPIAVLSLACAWLLLCQPFSGPLARYWGELGSFFPQRFFFFLLGMVIALYPTKMPKWQIRVPSVLIYFGQISYSTYLVHWPILASLNALFASVRTQMPHDLYACLLFIAGTPLIFLSSILLYEYVEKSGIAAGRVLIRNRTYSELGFENS